jgi:hypothetical protein
VPQRTIAFVDKAGRSYFCHHHPPTHFPSILPMYGGIFVVLCNQTGEIPSLIGHALFTPHALVNRKAARDFPGKSPMHAVVHAADVKRGLSDRGGPLRGVYLV